MKCLQSPQATHTNTHTHVNIHYTTVAHTHLDISKREESLRELLAANRSVMELISPPSDGGPKAGKEVSLLLDTFNVCNL